MNPFTESTVARPLPENIKAGPSPSSSTQPQPAHVPSPPAVRQEPGSTAGPSIAAILQPAKLFSVLHRCLRRGAKDTVRLGRSRVGACLLALGLGLAVPGFSSAVDVNVATLEQLRSVRGIGPKTAQTIIDERTRGGKYESFDDLSERVKGIGAKKAATLQASGLTLSGGGAAQSSSAGIGSKPGATSAKAGSATSRRSSGK